MDTKYFNSADLNDKANFIWEYGEFIVNRDYYGYKLCLYAMPGFYAEIGYSPIENKILSIESFTSTEKQIEKYLHLIDLSLVIDLPANDF